MSEIYSSLSLTEMKSSESNTQDKSEEVDLSNF